MSGRRKHFDAETARTLFGDEEAMIEASLARQRVLEEPGLTESERAQQLAQIEEALPEAIREQRARARAPLRGWQEEQHMQRSGASPAEIHRYRVETFGPEAAARLAELDRVRAERASMVE